MVKCHANLNNILAVKVTKLPSRVSNFEFRLAADQVYHPKPPGGCCWWCLHSVDKGWRLHTRTFGNNSSFSHSPRIGFKTLYKHTKNKTLGEQHNHAPVFYWVHRLTNTLWHVLGNRRHHQATPTFGYRFTLYLLFNSINLRCYSSDGERMLDYSKKYLSDQWTSRGKYWTKYNIVKNFYLI